LLGSLLVFCGPELGAQAIRPELLERGKIATVLVEVGDASGPARRGAQSGSGFCVDKSGLFITSAHLVASATGAGQVRLLLDAGKASQRRLPATVLRRDDQLGFALLQARGGAMPAPLELGHEAGLLELAQFYTLVEAKQDTKVLATLRRRGTVTVTRATATATQPRPKPPSQTPVPSVARLDEDEEMVRLGGVLSVSGAAQGAGKDIRPPAVALPLARLTPGSGEAPYVLQLPGTISDVTAGGAGRFMLLTLEKARKVAVFDANAAEVVRMINLPSEHALVAAGARKTLILFPSERLLQRWNLAKLEREGGTRPAPIKGWVRRLVMGSDSDGPALAFWHEGMTEAGGNTYRFSFIDLDSLTVLKVGTIGKVDSSARISASGRSFTTDWSLREHVRIRASATGSLFAMGNTGIGQSPPAFSVHGDAITGVQLNGDQGQLLPGPDGHMIFTGSGSRLDAAGALAGSTPASQATGSRPMLVPTPDPGIYLSVAGVPAATVDIYTRQDAPPLGVTVTVHSSGDGSPLLTVYGLDEMNTSRKPEDWYQDDFTAEKHFHYVPAANLLVTIPPSNDRLALRRLDIHQARSGAGGDRLAIVSLPTVTATAGRELVHQIDARSKKRSIHYTLARGPDGLNVDAEGKVTWTVPQALKGQNVSAVVVVGDESGEELFHTLRIHVE
jgi:hypothetical protein